MGIRKNTVKIKTALISLSDKSNLKPLLSLLKKHNIKIISSGGTYKKIKDLGFKCLEVSKFTNSKELLDGRVKTLHPKIHAGILNVRQNKKHQKEMKINNYVIFLNLRICESIKEKIIFFNICVINNFVPNSVI